jgi:hypothetical protein
MVLRGIWDLPGGVPFHCFTHCEPLALRSSARRGEPRRGGADFGLGGCATSDAQPTMSVTDSA